MRPRAIARYAFASGCVKVRHLLGCVGSVQGVLRSAGMRVGSSNVFGRGHVALSGLALARIGAGPDTGQ